MDLGKKRKKHGTFPQEDPIRRVIRIKKPEGIPVELPAQKPVPIIREREVNTNASTNAQSPSLGRE